MKKLLVIGLALSLLAIAPHIECSSASAQALRYLRAAGAAAWQNTKKTTQWSARNPYKIASVAILTMATMRTVATFHVFDKNFEHDEYFVKKNLIKHPLLSKMITETCMEHGIKNIIIASESANSSFYSFRNGSTMIIYVGKQVLDSLEQKTKETQTSFKIRHWEPIIIHEISHLLENDSAKTIASIAILQSKPFKDETVTAVTFAANVHALRKGIKTILRLSPSPQLRIISVVPLIACIYLLNKTIEKTDKSFKDFSRIYTELAKYCERRADKYVIETAFKNRDPQLLDNFAECFEIFIKQNGDMQPSNSIYPPNSKRAQDARTAAAELREEIRTGKPAEIVVNHYCSPF